MNYLIIYNDATGTLDKKDFHKRITEQLSATDWWHYIPNGYIITTSVPSAGITNSLAGWFPGLLFLIIEVSFNSASGVLPQEAFDWIGKKKNPFIRIKQTPLPKIKVRSLTAVQAPGVLLRSLGLGPIPTKTTRFPQTIEELLKMGK
ncbi:MAG: hypothetical protein Q7R95_08950 [bacterium]|nr:hypothetical protein [bacterium]